MPAALGPRFALEAGFLVLLAVAVGFANLSPALIILVMAVAWLLVALIEYFAWRQGPRFSRRAAAVQEPAAQEEFIAQEQAVEEAPPPPPPAPPPAPTREEETLIEPPPEPRKEGKETTEQADERVAAARLAFDTEARRLKHRLDPLQPRPRRRWLIFGPRERSGSREEED